MSIVHPFLMESCNIRLSIAIGTYVAWLIIVQSILSQFDTLFIVNGVVSVASGHVNFLLSTEYLLVSYSF